MKLLGFGKAYTATVYAQPQGADKLMPVMPPMEFEATAENASEVGWLLTQASYVALANKCPVLLVVRREKQPAAQ